jgi:hypothetical protein
MAKTIDDIFGQDHIDSRDVIERIEELEELNSNDEGEFTWDSDEDREEYEALVLFRDSIYDDAEFEFGIDFIADWAFKDYAQELAEDIGAIDRDADWPNSYIDWDAASEALQMDYTSVTVQGEEYWYR